MPTYPFVTVDVFTDRRFGGNPLAVVTDARGLSSWQMQSLAAEFNLSETAFVLPPDDPSHTARVRIFHRTAEMPFAGHPTVGAGYVLAGAGRDRGGVLLLEVMAGVAEVRVERNGEGTPIGATVSAPQPLSLGTELPVDVVAACAGLAHSDVVVDGHRPTVASVGTTYIIAQVRPDALTRAMPVLAEFRRAVASWPTLQGRGSLLLYARTAEGIRSRMFAPLAGTTEDPATGSANAALGALLLSRTDAETMHETVVQGVELGRPSRLVVAAYRTPGGIRATVGGGCVPVSHGELLLD